MKWSDRAKQIERPLFKSYLFARFPTDAIYDILSVRGVIRVLGDSAGPIAVPAADIETIRELIASGARLHVAPGTHHYHAGEDVAIMRGPFRGNEGTVIRVGKRRRVVVTLEILNRTVFAELDEDSLRPAVKVA